MSETVGERRGKLTVTVCDPDPGCAQADVDLTAIESGTVSQVVRSDVSEGYVHQLRLRVAEDPSLLSHIDVYYLDPSGVQHRIGLTGEDIIHWPPGFFTHLWDTERRILEICRARRAPPAESER